MAEAADNTDTPESGQGEGVPEGTSQTSEDGRVPAFNEEQEQYLKSWMGRVEKGITEKLNTFQPQNYVPPHAVPENQQNDLRAIDKFNQELQDQFFEGDVVGVVQKVQGLLNNAQQAADVQTQTKLNQALTSFSDKPYYKDIFDDMSKIAGEAAAQGVQPEHAAEYAYTKAFTNYATGRMGGDGGGLNFEQGGQRQTTQKTKIPPRFAEAAKRDIAQGLFKNEAEYIANLSPQIKQQYNLG